MHWQGDWHVPQQPRICGERETIVQRRQHEHVMHWRRCWFRGCSNNRATCKYPMTLFLANEHMSMRSATTTNNRPRTNQLRNETCHIFSKSFTSIGVLLCCLQPFRDANPHVFLRPKLGQYTNKPCNQVTPNLRKTRKIACARNQRFQSANKPRCVASSKMCYIGNTELLRNKRENSSSTNNPCANRTIH